MYWFTLTRLIACFRRFMILAALRSHALLLSIAVWRRMACPTASPPGFLQLQFRQRRLAPNSISSYTAGICLTGRRVNFGRIDLQVTFDDPGAYRRPWTVPVNVTFAPDTDLLEAVCNENESQGTQHLIGRLRSGGSLFHRDAGRICRDVSAPSNCEASLQKRAGSQRRE
jgi:hypothetical protein